MMPKFGLVTNRLKHPGLGNLIFTKSIMSKIVLGWSWILQEWAKWLISAASLQAGTQPSEAAWHRTLHWQPRAVPLRRSDNKLLLDFHMSKATFQFFCKELTDLIIATGCPSTRRNWCAQGNCYRFWSLSINRECQFLPHRGEGKIAKGCQGRTDWSHIWRIQ